ELLHDPGREVLEHHVGRGAEAQCQVVALGACQVEGDPTLVGVGRVGQWSPLPPLWIAGYFGAREAHEVRAHDRLNLDHVCAKTRQHLGGARAGPPCSQVEYPEAGQGKCGLVCSTLPRLPGLPIDRAIVFTRSRYRAERTWHDIVQAEGNPWLAEPTRRVIDEDPAGHELLELGHCRTVEHRSHGDAQEACLFEDRG